jgi:hypothetical protein
MPQPPKKYYKPTPTQEYQRILKAEDQAILDAYVKSGDPAAIAHQKVLRVQELRRSNAATAVPSGKEYNRAKAKRDTDKDIKDNPRS